MGLFVLVGVGCVLVIAFRVSYFWVRYLIFLDFRFRIFCLMDIIMFGFFRVF